MRLGLKLLIPPLVIAAVALSAGTLYGVLNYRESSAAHQAVQADLNSLKTIADAREQTSQVRGSVFRALALISSLDDAKLKVIRTGLAQQVQGVQRVLADVPANSDNDAEVGDLVKHTLPLLERYLKQCDRAIDLSGTDPNVGVSAMRAAEDSYAEIVKALQVLLKRNETLQTARIDAAEGRTLQRSVLLGGLMLLATGAALLFAWRAQRAVVQDLAEAVRVSAAVADGRLDIEAEMHGDDEIGDLLRSQGHMVGKLSASLHTVRIANDNIGNAAREIASGNTDLSQRTEEAANALQRTASSMEELTGTVRQTADSARTANQLAASASGVAEHGGVVVAQVVTTMNDINASARRIGDIVATIDGIAFQTNILALNASVEAARAGEQGRGFAVVASEVRSLAQRSAEAAREIKQLIVNSAERVEAGSQQVAAAGQTMNEIVVSVRRVSDIIGEISAATAEQSAGISHVNDAVADLDSMTQQNAALVEQSAAAAESLRAQAGRLTEVLGYFELGADGSAIAANAAIAPVAKARTSTISRVASRAVVASTNAGSNANTHASLPVPRAKSLSPTVHPATSVKATAAASADAWESF